MFYFITGKGYSYALYTMLDFTASMDEIRNNCAVVKYPIYS